MADALCGPSNPLQSFQKHTSADRTLQQDRLSSRAGPSQGFRSDPYGTAGILDKEFEAFQAGPHQQPDFVDHQLHPVPSYQFQPAPAPFRSSPQPNLAWASDFQQLKISTPPPTTSLRQQLPGQKPQSNWHNDFQHPKETPLLYFNQPNYRPALHTSDPFLHVEANGKRRLVDEEQFDSTAFEREFEAHASTVLQEDDLAKQQDTELLRKQTHYQEKIALLEKEHMQNLERSAQDYEMLQNESLDPSVHGRAMGDEELAATAAELLDRVSDNTTQKFKESNFLALMSRLRDREVRVDGDKIVEVDNLEVSAIYTSTLDAVPGNVLDPGRNISMAGALNPADDPKIAQILHLESSPSHQARTERDQASDRPPLAHKIYTAHVVDDF